DGEALRLGVWHPREALRARRVDVAAGRRADVARDRRAPAEVVGWRDVGQEVEALVVAKVRAGLDEAGGIDDEGRLAVRLDRADEPGDALGGHQPTPTLPGPARGRVPARAFPFRL